MKIHTAPRDASIMERNEKGIASKESPRKPVEKKTPKAGAADKPEHPADKA